MGKLKEKAVSALILMLLLTSMLTVAFNLQPAKAEGTIYIRADGNVDPPDAPIQRNGDVYTLTANITVPQQVHAIVIERDNMTLNGAGHAIQGGASYGIDLSHTNNVTIKDVELWWHHIGISLIDASNSTIVENNIESNSFGIYFLTECTGNRIYHNNFISNIGAQIVAYGLSNDFDDGYPSGGNYWSDYTGADLYHGPYQNELGSDRIGDTPYTIDTYGRRDNYPLMWPINDVTPKITSVYRNPVDPDYDEGVIVTANVIDDKAVDEALLSYTYESTWHNVSMNRFDDIFNATIPGQMYGASVQYEILANDTDGNWALRKLYSYTVGDSVSPEVELSQIPDYPLSAQKVKVYADVTEPVNASGVETVLFSYRVNSGEWWNSPMTFNGTSSLYESTIPQQEPRDAVEYFVKATDNAGNVNTTQTYSYVVGLAGDADHDGDVDYDDFIILAGNYGGEGPPADFDLDGDVDYADFILLAANYGQHM